jgi:hypothetical protein
MVSLLFRDFSDLVHKIQRLTEIWKCKSPNDVMRVDNLPMRHLLREVLQILAGERRHSTSARDARLARKVWHEFISSIRGSAAIVPEQSAAT